MKYIVHLYSLPLNDNDTPEAAARTKVNTRFRRHLAKVLGIKLALVGRSSPQPFYALRCEFTSKDEVDGVIATIEREVRSAVAEGRLLHTRAPGSLFAEEAVAAPATLLAWNYDRPYWG